MTRITVETDPRGARYDVSIGHGTLTELITELSRIRPTKTVAVIDRRIAEVHAVTLNRSLPRETLDEAFLIDGSESSKSTEMLIALWEYFARQRLDRRSVIINIGGGVVTDLGGLAASTYMRGVPFIQVPTTLLAQVDASIGGKTGINFGGVKNLIGTVTQPSAVVVDLMLLNSLPEREFRSGFAEIVKHGMIVDRSLAERLASRDCRDWNTSDLDAIVLRSIEIKKEVVQKDPFEGGHRKILNFGHTFGHAIESDALKSEDALLHGEAIAIGMLAEGQLAHEAGMLPAAELDLLRSTIWKSGVMPPVVPTFNPARIRELVLKDKKNTHARVKWSLITAVGTARYDVELDSALLDKILDTAPVWLARS
jgi:3-dehydroquinate synthase